MAEARIIFVDGESDTFGFRRVIHLCSLQGHRRAQDFLKSSPETAWLHEILFEHKEFLAYAPWLLALVALVIVIAFGSRIIEAENKRAKKLILFSLITSLLFVLIVASEAVLITKVAPLK